MNTEIRIILTTAILIAAILSLAACDDTGIISSTSPQETVSVLPPVQADNRIIADAIVVPIHDAQLSLSTGGIVSSVMVKEGDFVQVDQELLKLESSRQAASVAQAEAQLQRALSGLTELQAGPRPQEVASAQAAVAAAQAQLDRVRAGVQEEEIEAARAALSSAQASLRKVQEGPREEELIAARADVANAQATLAQAQASYDRVDDAPDIQSRPESLQLEQATNAYQAALSRLEALKKGPTAADLDVARAGVQQAQAQLAALVAEARPAEVAAAEAEIRRAEAQLDLLLAGARSETVAAAQAEVAAAEAALQQAQAALDETVLRAPFAGTIATLDVQVGEQLGPGSPAVWLADLSSWQIETDDLTELAVVRVKEGARVTISFDAIPELDLVGRVVRIKPIGESKMGDITYTVLIAPEQEDERMRWNMTATVAIEPE